MDSCHYIYNPYLLKLIHGKAYYMDKLLCIYLPGVTRVKYDIMQWLLIYNYHVGMILRDITQLSMLCEKEQFGVDLYLVNFEFTLFRLCEQYIKEDPLTMDKDTDDGLYRCEAILKQCVETSKKRILMRHLCTRYLNRVYFDRHRDEYKTRVRERACLFFNLKHLVEEEFIRGITMNDDIVHYDKTAMMALMYLYFINEFIGDTSRTLNKRALKSSQKIMVDNIAYIKGETTESPPVVIIEEEENCDDLVFLEKVYHKLTDTLVEYVHGWCIKEKITVLNRDSPRVESKEEMRVRRHNEKYNHYTMMSVPSLLTYPYNDPAYREFLLAEEENESLCTKPIFLPLEEGKKFYEAITYEMLFHLRLGARHACMGSACQTCYYTYTHYAIHEFNKRCHANRYNKQRYGNDDMGDRVALDRYLKYTVIEVIPAFRGLIFRLFYHMSLILYHTEIVIKEDDVKRSRETDLFAMVDLGELIGRMTKKNDYFVDIEKRMQSVVVENRGGELRPIMEEKEDVRRLALDMTVLSDLISGIDKQYITIEKYERTLSKKVLPGNYKIHTQMMNYLKLLYIYYMRIMHSI